MPGRAKRTSEGSISHGPVVNKRVRPCEIGLGRPARIGTGTGKMRGIEAPERLHGHVEGALRPLRVGAGLRQQRDQFERRRRKPPVSVEAGGSRSRAGTG